MRGGGGGRCLRPLLGPHSTKNCIRKMGVKTDSGLLYYRIPPAPPPSCDSGKQIKALIRRGHFVSLFKVCCVQGVKKQKINKKVTLLSLFVSSIKRNHGGPAEFSRPPFWVIFRHFHYTSLTTPPPPRPPFIIFCWGNFCVLCPYGPQGIYQFFGRKFYYNFSSLN